MNISLTPKLEQFIRRKVASGLYGNASEVVRDALRLLVEREDQASGAQTGPDAPPAKEEVRARLAALERPLHDRGLTSLALFGSVVEGTARADSDIDILVEVDPQVRFSLVDLVALNDFLEERLGRKVDVVIKEAIEPAIRERVLAQAERVF